ncbi:MAG: RNA polymerase sigma factor [Phycisphaerae bacterium]
MSGSTGDSRGWQDRPIDAGVEAEFSAQFDACYRSFWLVAAGVVNNAALADDVVQEAAIIALNKLGEFEPGSNFRAWMGQIVRFVALNHLRKQRQRQAASLDPAILEVAVPHSPSSEPTPELHLSGRGQLPEGQHHFDDRVVHALGSLSEVARACLLLRTVEGLSYVEVASLLDIPEGTAMSHVHRARRQMRERLAGPTANDEKGEAR